VDNPLPGPIWKSKDQLTQLMSQNWRRLSGKWGHEVLEDTQPLRGQVPEK